MTIRINATHAHAERGLDPYWTPPEATRLEIESKDKKIVGIFIVAMQTLALRKRSLNRFAAAL